MKCRSCGEEIGEYDIYCIPCEEQIQSFKEKEYEEYPTTETNFLFEFRMDKVRKTYYPQEINNPYCRTRGY